MMIRCVDWDTEKANEREARGKNRSDPYIMAMANGTPNGEYIRDENLNLDKNRSPCVFRGLGKSPHIHKCIANNIDYYYIDTGYFGNFQTKVWHRIVKNNVQTLNTQTREWCIDKLKATIGKKSEEILDQRFAKIFGRYEVLDYYRRERGNTILVVPPSQKVFNHFGGDAEKWLEDHLKEFKKYTNKNIVVREKKSRGERTGFTLQDQLKNGTYDSIITFNSIASLEAIQVGFPATVLGPNAGSILSNTDITKIDNPKYPKSNEIKNHFYYLALCQFTSEEMLSGFAYSTIERLQGDQKPNNFKL